MAVDPNLKMAAARAAAIELPSDVKLVTRLFKVAVLYIRIIFSNTSQPALELLHFRKIQDGSRPPSSISICYCWTKHEIFLYPSDLKPTARHANISYHARFLPSQLFSSLVGHRRFITRDSRMLRAS